MTEQSPVSFVLFFVKCNALFIFIGFLFINIDLAAQKQNNQWRFGYGSGIDFNSTPLSVVTGSSSATGEGGASVADRNTGKLLFYTDGVTVWGANDQPMPNGNNLFGGTPSMLSSTTAAVIIPKPGSNNLFYIITIDEGATTANSRGLRYSLIDMSLNSGLGDVVVGQKNIFLFQTGSERAEVAPVADGSGYWIITHDFGTFACFKVTSAGIQNTPVISTVGGNLPNTAGHLKVNRQFNKLACGSLFENRIKLFDFNNTTGVVSDLISWTPPSDFVPLVYGVEFSPSGEFLYVSDINTIYQYNIKQLNEVAIQNSAYRVAVGMSYATMQLGPDGKIYINAGPICFISCPNKAGANCGYESSTIPGGGYGLPKWIYYPNDTTTFFKPNVISYADSCFGKATQFSLRDTTGISSVAWLFGDSASQASNSASGNNVNHIFTKPGSYRVRAILVNKCGPDTLFLNIEIVNCILPCSGIITTSNDSCLKSATQFSITADSTIIDVNWNFGDSGSGANNEAMGIAQVHTFSAAGTFLVRAIVKFSCGTDTLYKNINITDCTTPPKEDCKIFIPNTFTPNADSINDKFFPSTQCLFEHYRLFVYNRWGQLVFETTNQLDKWNGTSGGADCTEGVYFYLIDYKFPSEQPLTKYGTITLLK
jgi:gliding motility-associated-like protein